MKMSGDLSDRDTTAEARYSSFPEADEFYTRKKKIERLKLQQQLEVDEFYGGKRQTERHHTEQHKIPQLDSELQPRAMKQKEQHHTEQHKKQQLELELQQKEDGCHRTVKQTEQHQKQQLELELLPTTKQTELDHKTQQLELKLQYRAMKQTEKLHKIQQIVTQQRVLKQTGQLKLDLELELQHRVMKQTEQHHKLQQLELELQQKKDEWHRVTKQIRQDEDPSQSTFGKVISSLQQAFQYPFRLLNSWRQELLGLLLYRTIKITSPTTPEPKTLHGSLHNNQRLLHRRLLDTCTDFMRKKLDIVKIVKGNACTIRAFGSDVILHTPEGLHAVVLGNIHVNHAQFQHLVPANECIVGPICEYSIHALIYSPALQPGAKYKLQIPHVIRDIEEVKHHIRVRHGNIHGDAHNLKLGPELLQSNNAEEWYEVDNHFITIYTSNFSGYIVTVEGINCCSGSANLLLFGSLTNAPDEEPLATLKVYMSSAHSTQIRDYRTALKRYEMLLKRHLVNMKEIQIATDVYDASKSTIKMSILPKCPEKWRAYGNMELSFETTLNKALKYNDGHICKRNLTDVADFCLESTDQTAKLFRGTLDVNLTIVQTSQGIMTKPLADLTVTELSKLSREITPDNMRVIAREYLDFQPSEIDTLAYSRCNDILEFKFKILHTWKTKHVDNNREKLVDILEQAANEGLLDYAIIDNVLRPEDY